MDPDFWHERWAHNEIGFHQPDGNPMLMRHWAAAAPQPGARILVPLCGKTPDMAWLAARGYEVTGVELSERAARDFFAEQRIDTRISTREGFRMHSGGGVDIWVGDFFAMPATELAGCAALYDRASLIALPPEMRHRFAAKLCAELPRECTGLLVALDYPQQEMAGPPFSVAEDELRALFEPHFELTLLETVDALAGNSRFQERLSCLEESAYRFAPVAR